MGQKCMFIGKDYRYRAETLGSGQCIYNRPSKDCGVDIRLCVAWRGVAWITPKVHCCKIVSIADDSRTPDCRDEYSREQDNTNSTALLHATRAQAATSARRPCSFRGSIVSALDFCANVASTQDLPIRCSSIRLYHRAD